MKITRIESLDYVGMNATLPLADGVTTLTGENAGGKTMLVSIVPGILFNEATLQNGATIGFGWQKESETGSMLVTKQNKKTIWRGTDNGTAKEHNTIKAATNWMREHFPISESVFPTVNYLAAFRSGTMLGGKPSERMALLSDIVGLRLFDDLRGAINKMAQNANLTAAMRERIIRDISDIENAGYSKPLFTLQGLVPDLAAKHSVMRVAATRLADALDDRPFGNIATEDLNKLLKLEPERRKAWDAWEEFQDLGGENIKKPKRRDYNAARALQEILDYDPDLYLISGKVKMIYDATKQQAKLISAKTEVAQIETQLSHFEDHNGNTCPTCNSKIDTKFLVKTLNRSLDNKIADIKRLERKVKIAKSSDAIKRILKEWKVSTDEIKIVSKFDYEDIIERYEAVEKLEAKFGGKFPTKPEKQRIPLSELEAELRLRKKGYGLLKDDIRKYERISSKLASASGVLSAVSEVAEQQVEIITNHKRIKSLEDELAGLPNGEEAAILIEIMKKLDNRNARNKYLDLVAEHLISSLNEEASRFFDYSMEFAWHNGQLIANRKGAATDTVLLSGREGRTFLLLNAVAIQKCLPPAKRLRTLILDELEAGSDKKNKALLSELIPPLQAHYDNIVVVTPLSKSEFYVEGPRYRVTKDKTLVREE